VNPDRQNRPRGRPRRTSAVSLDACPELERETKVPLYYQLAANLFEALEVKRPKAGEPFPTERQLEERFSVSRPVVRESLKLLVADGAIYRVQGQGTFVAPKRRQLRPQGLIGIFADEADRLSVEILNASTQVPRPAVSSLLGLKRDTKVVSVMSIVRRDGKSLGLIESNFAPVLSSFVLSAVDQLRADGSQATKPDRLRLTKTSARIEQTCMGPWGGPKLGSSPGDPALMAHLVHFGTTGAGKREGPLEYAHLICPSRSVQLVAELS
jgi:DNA-binding GntR family transcriptional regulator